MTDGGDDRPREWTYNRVANDTAGWIELNIQGLQSSDGSPIPVRLLVNRFKSSSPDSEAFIHDPIAVFMAAAATVDAFRPIDRSWHVTTIVVNHEATLSATHTYNSVVVDSTTNNASITTHKKQ